MTGDPNLRYLERHWLLGQPAERGLRYIRKASDKTLSVLLRHHDDTDEGISDRETWLRDDVDFLLGFYSIIEIALMIKFVGELPNAFSENHLRVLNHPAVRRYYEWNYPLDLPRRLRERILFGVAYDLDEDALLHAFFYEFLELTKAVERDKDMESFLWCLDGGYREDKHGTCDLDAVTRALSKSNKLAEATQRPPDERSELDRALNGFCKFIQFCETMDSLIQQLERTPQLAEAMWLAHAYWFQQLQADMGSDLKKAVLSLAKWNVGGKDKAALKLRVGEVMKTLSRLSAPPANRWNLRPEPKWKLREQRMSELQHLTKGLPSPWTKSELSRLLIEEEEMRVIRLGEEQEPPPLTEELGL
jgi:hypothetical protein